MLKYETVCNVGGILIRPTSLKTFIDAWIPFNIYIAYAYIPCLLYVPFSGLLYAFNRRINAIQFISFYFSAILIWLSCYAIYLVFPTTAQGVMISSFDPKILNQGMFTALQGIYTSSTPLGDFPSLHIAPLVFMSIFLYKRWRLLFWIFLPFAFFGAIGTVLLKFHTVVGLLGGVAMGIFGYYVLYEKLALKYLNKFLIEKEIVNKKSLK
jgi:membrane-associated phospholipid phosphatase